MTIFNAIGHFCFRRRNALFPILLVLLVAAFPPSALDAPGAGVLLALGLGILALGQGFRVVTIGMDYIRRGGKNGRIHADRLVTGGVFAHCRNPMYAGNVLMVLGFLMIAGHPAGIVVGGVLFLLIYAAIVHSEEDFLVATFGEAYRDYCRRVPRWIPRPAGLSRTLAGYRFDWAAVVIREYGTLFTTALIVIALLVWKAGLSGDLAAAAPVFAALFVFSVAAWGVARYLKKSRRLRPLQR